MIAFSVRSPAFGVAVVFSSRLFSRPGTELRVGCLHVQAMAGAGDVTKPKEVQVDVDLDLGGIQEAPVPASVFGDTLEALEREKRGEAPGGGALSLFKRKRHALVDEE